MPYSIKPVSKTKYMVENSETGSVKSTGSTLSNAQKQVKLLNAVKHGFSPQNRYNKQIPPLKTIKMNNARPVMME